MAGTWVVPAERMKARREHRVPLSGAAVELLARHICARAIISSPVFREGGPAAVQHGAVDDLASHGRGDLTRMASEARSAIGRPRRRPIPATWLRRRWPMRLTKVEAAYRRGDLFEKRRALMRDWAALCAASSGENIVPLRKARGASR